MHQHLRAGYKSQTVAAVPLFGHVTKLRHTLIGSAALVAAVACPGKASRITPTRDKQKERKEKTDDGRKHPTTAENTRRLQKIPGDCRKHPPTAENA